MKEAKKIQMVGSICLMSSKEVLDFVPKEIYEDIKKRDATPMFAMMSIGNQGESRGAMFEGTPGMGKKLSAWYKQLWPLRAVKQLVSYMKGKSYVPLYEAHPDGDPTEQRPVVGTIINGIKKVIDNVTHAVGIAYINNYGTRKKLERGDFNACSLEATCIFSEAENMFKYIVENVKSLSGVALCNSEVTPPGFDDANILAVVTAMAPPSDDDDEDDEGGKKRKRSKAVTIEEVKKYIKDHEVRPGTLFSTEEMTKDGKVIEAFKTEHDKEMEELKKTNKDLTEKLKPLEKQTHSTRVAEAIGNSDLLKDELKEVVGYLKKSVSVEAVEGEDLQITVDKAVKVALENMKTAGIKTKFAEAEEEKEDDDPKKKEEKGKHKEKDKSDMTDPDNNELIPKD
jgi:hypothetical protein